MCQSRVVLEESEIEEVKKRKLLVVVIRGNGPLRP